MSRVRLLALPASRRALVTAALVVLAVAAYTATAGDGSGGAPERGQKSVGSVVRVVDGDTIHVQVDGRREKVRYIGVDTPESVKPDTPVQCFAKKASAFNDRLVAGERVRLVRDAEARDRYGRLLAYVYRARDGLFVNAALVRRGYALTLTIPPNVAHADEFRRLAASAHRKGRGLWSSCRSS
jgi:micrococcal nuclease